MQSPQLNSNLLMQSDITASELCGHWRFFEAGDVKGLQKSMLADRLVPGMSTLSLKSKQCVEIANREGLWGHDRFTINFWLKLRTEPGDHVSLMTKGSVAPYEFRIHFGINSKFTFASEKISWYGAHSSQSVWTGLDVTTLCDKWTMLSLSMDQGTIRSYIDGQLDTESMAYDTGKLNITTSAIIVGAETQYKIPGIDGWIGELAIIKRALPEAELQALYAKYCKQIPELNPPVQRPAGLASLQTRSVTPLKGVDQVFEQPGPEYRMTQFAQGWVPPLVNLEDYGIGNIQLGVAHENYLRNEKAWGDVLTLYDQAKKRGMGFWLADDDQYPGSAAGGLTVDGHPELASIGVYQHVEYGTGLNAITVKLPKEALRIVAAVLYPVEKGGIQYKQGVVIQTDGQTAATNGMVGRWAFCVYISKKMLGYPERREYWLNKGEMPNLLNSKAIKRFIELTYDTYKQRLGSRFRDVIAFYTGETSLDTTVTLFPAPWPKNPEAYLPWEDGLQNTFRSDHGYELAPCLAVLFAPKSDEGNIIRHHFWQSVGNMVSTNCFGQMEAWCRKNGAGLSGHLVDEEFMTHHVCMYGNFMQQMSHFKIPGYDHYMYKHGLSQTTNLMIQRYAYSEGRARGVHVAQSLIEPIVTGWFDFESGKMRKIPISVLRRNMNMMFAGGASIINSYLYWGMYPASVYRELTDYAARLSYLLRGARDVAKVAIYYPIETFQGRYRPTVNDAFSFVNDAEYSTLQARQNELCEELFKHNISFNYLNAEAIGKAELAGRSLRIAGYDYRVMIMPDMDIIPLPVLEKLKRYQHNGGVLIWTGKLPHLGDSDSETPQVKRLLTDAVCINDPKRLVDKIRRVGEGELAVKASMPRKFYTVPFERMLDGRLKKLTLLVNEHCGTNLLEIGGHGQGTLFDPWKSEYATVSLPLSVGIGAYCALVLVTG
ncbi:MAG: LamG-like jellyroll fold domain-containing protein [Armatimonadota bacterium]